MKICVSCHIIFNGVGLSGCKCILHTHSCISLGNIIFSYFCGIFPNLFLLTDQIMWHECSCEYQKNLGKFHRQICHDILLFFEVQNLRL